MEKIMNDSSIYFSGDIDENIQINHSITFFTKNMEETINFYVGILGFHLKNYFKSNNYNSDKFDWIILKEGSLEIQFQSDSSDHKFNHNESSKSNNNQKYSKNQECKVKLKLFISNIERLYQKLSDLHNNKIKLGELISTPYGTQEFSVVENNGYHLIFTEIRASNRASYTNQPNFNNTSKKQRPPCKICKICGMENSYQITYCEACGAKF